MKKLFIFILLLISSNVCSFEIPSGSSKGLGNSISLSNPDITSVINSGINYSKIKFGIQLGILRNYDLQELDEYYLGLVSNNNGITTCFGFSQFGDNNIYTEKILKLGVGYRVKNIVFSLNCSYKKLDFNNNYSSLSAKTFGFSTGYQHHLFLVGIVFDNISTPKYTNNSPRTDLKTKLYFELMSKNNYQTLLHYEFNKNKDNRFGFGEKIKLSPSFALFTGFTTNPSTFGGGLECKLNSQLFVYSTSYHPILGFTHAFSFTFIN